VLQHRADWAERIISLGIAVFQCLQRSGAERCCAAIAPVGLNELIEDRSVMSVLESWLGFG
jgi:hypothetical protein